MRSAPGLALGLAMALSGCAAAGPERPQPATSKPIAFQLDAGGVQLSDRPQRIDFGRTDHSAIPAMTKLVGQPPSGAADCPEGGQLVTWPDGTGLVMKRGVFRGWVSGALGARAGAVCT